jgi:hypothetical protein
VLPHPGVNPKRRQREREWVHPLQCKCRRPGN